MAARGLRYIPGVARGASAVSERSRARIKEMEKQYGNRTSDELASMASGLAPFQRTAIAGILAGRGDLTKLEEKQPGSLERTIKIAKRYGMPTGEYEKYKPSLAGINKTGAERKQSIEKAVNNQTADMIKDTSKDTEEIRNQEVREAMRKRYGETHLKEFDKAADVNDKSKESAKLLFESFAELGTTMEEIANNLEKIGNTSAAKFLRSEEGERIFRERTKDDAGNELPIASKRRLDLADSAQLPTVIKSIKPADVEDVNFSGLDGSAIQKMFESFGSGHVQKIIDKGGDAADKFFNEFVSLGDTFQEITDELRNRKNTALASWVQSGPGSKDLLKTYKNTLT